MKRSAIVLLCVLASLGPLSAHAATYVVAPDGTGDFSTIQAAIDSAATGDVIELTDGTFTGDGNRDLHYDGKGITVRSQSGNPGACIIDCQGSTAEPHHGFRFHSYETSAAVVEGIKIMNGAADGTGGVLAGAVCCQYSSPTIRNCVFADNVGISNKTGAITCWYGSSPQITGCTFSNNAGGYGGGMYCFMDSSPEIISCTFAGNLGGNRGGGIVCEFNSSPNITYCTFCGNGALYGGGIYSGYNNSSPTLQNVIIASSVEGEAVNCGVQGTATINCCDIYGNAGGPGCVAGQIGSNGNFAADPLFCNPETGDFQLSTESPCTAANQPDCDRIGAWDAGCGPTAIGSDSDATWSSVKAIYR